MAASSCSECSGTRWVRYFSETTDGNFEEAFRLCPCNHKPKMRRKLSCEKSEGMEDTEGGSARPPKGSAQDCPYNGV